MASTPVQPKPLEGEPAKSNRLAPIDRDLPAINEAKELRILFTYNSTGYFIYRGETMGYEYDLLNLFAKEHKLRLRPVVVRDSSKLFEQLDRGEGDVIAAQLAAGSDQSQVALSDPLYETSPAVVQRVGEAVSSAITPTVKRSVKREELSTELKPIEIKARLITTPAELGGQRVYLPQSSFYRQRLFELNEELTNDVVVVEVDESSDRLIQRLAEGEISYTVAAENVAALRAGEYSNLLVKPMLGPPQAVVWGVRTNAPQLREELNRWLAAKRKKGLLRGLYQKYFLNRRAFQERVASRYLTGETGRLSAYDDFFRESAKIPGWDWRLVASQAYQESRFNPNAHSWAGALGLMQIMPATARELKINAHDPRQSIEGACRYLWKLDHELSSIADEGERRKFILASYNVGRGHVEDARRLARKFGDDPDRWSDVAYWLIRKSKRDVYNDPVVKYGFARGTEPVAYVDLIFDRYEHYRAFVHECDADCESRK
jgi:membrane-bound lytic murein transglycosylase F